jgi:hypothetical protein
MSFRVLIIPEDPTYNGYILKPLVQRMLTETGKAQARVTLLTNPKLGGINEAKAAIRSQLPLAYAHFDLWLFLPDAECASGLEDLERDAAVQGIRLICCAARPEVEAWLLAGHREKLAMSWGDVVNHRNLKEEVFEPFLAQHGDRRRAGGGRDLLIKATLNNYRGLLTLCPELNELERKLSILAHGQE